MLFSSITFIYLFLPLLLLIYFIVPNRASRNIILLIGSLIFYAWGEPIYILLMIFSIVNDYVHAILIDKNRDSDVKLSKFFLISSVTINLSLLLFFKYLNFFIGNINNIFNLDIIEFNLRLPIGISFYTFQTMSYTIDVYTGRVKVQKNFLALATYVSMFPQLIAGPIVRYRTIEKELTERKETIDDIAYGLRRFIIGLGKKVIIANQVGFIADQVFSINSNMLTTQITWYGIIAFALQIYFDFSGYSDMAIGLGRVFGFKFLENFNYPYSSKSITDFWRRWHISLGTFFRDYVYIPLGGNRVGKIKFIRNILIVWGITGFWHGAQWTFVIWGIYYGIILLLEKYLWKDIIERLPILRNIYTLLLVTIGWVIFRSDNLKNVLDILGAMGGLNGGSRFIDFRINGIDHLWIYLVIGFVGCTTIFKSIEGLLNKRVFYRFVLDTYFAVIFIISTLMLVNGSFNPFLYFRF